MSTKLGVLQCVAVVLQQVLMVYSVLSFVLDAVRKSVRFIILAQIEETRLFTGVTHTCLKKSGDIICTAATWSFNVFL